MIISDELESARIAILEQDLSKARSILRKVLEQDPRCVDAWLLFADAAQKPEHAIQCLERVLLLDPGNATATARLEQLNTAPIEASQAEQRGAFQVYQGTAFGEANRPPTILEQPKTSAPKAIPPPTKIKSSFSNTERFLVAILGVLVFITLCVLGYVLLRGPLMGNVAGRPSPTPTDYTAIIHENIRASNAEDKEAYMATIHPRSPAYKATEQTLDTIFNNYDLSYEISGLSVIEENSREVKLSYILVTRKILGGDFRDNQIDGIITLRKDGGVWKIYNQTVDNVKYFN